LTGGTTQRGTDQGSGEHGSGCEPPEFVLVERQRTAEDEAVETGRRARRRIERLRLAQRQSKRHGTPFLAKQRCLLTDREDARERGDGRSGQVDVPSDGRFVPSSKNQGSEFNGYAYSPAADDSAACTLVSRRSAVGSGFMIVHGTNMDDGTSRTNPAPWFEIDRAGVGTCLAASVTDVQRLRCVLTSIANQHGVFAIEVPFPSRRCPWHVAIVY
jgi:hypothetical protein